MCFAFQTFSLSQSVIVLVSAMSAFFMVAIGKRIGFGRYDWILLSMSLAIPVGIGVPMLALDWFGPAGFW